MAKLINKDRLKGVNGTLVNIVTTAVAMLPFDVTVIEGLRSLDRQKQLVAEGKSRTLKSKHLEGNAVDLAPVKGGKIDWNDRASFMEIGKMMQLVAAKSGVRMRSGYDWDNDGIPDEQELEDYIKQFGHKPLVDYPHHELI